jgi:hypothetical protein
MTILPVCRCAPKRRSASGSSASGRIESITGDTAAPTLDDTRDVGQLVTQTRRHQHTACRQLSAVCEQNAERRPCASGNAGHVAGEDHAAVTRHLGAPGGEELLGRKPVPRQEPLHVGSGRVARCSGIDDRDGSPGTGQDQCRGQTGRAAADDGDVVVGRVGEVYVLDHARHRLDLTTSVAVSGKNVPLAARG